MFLIFDPIIRLTESLVMEQVRAIRATKGREPKVGDTQLFQGFVLTLRVVRRAGRWLWSQCLSLQAAVGVCGKPDTRATVCWDKTVRYIACPLESLD